MHCIFLIDDSISAECHCRNVVLVMTVEMAPIIVQQVPKNFHALHTIFHCLMRIIMMCRERKRDCTYDSSKYGRSFAENGYKEYKMASMGKTNINMSVVSPIIVQ